MPAKYINDPHRHRYLGPDIEGENPNLCLHCACTRKEARDYQRLGRRYIPYTYRRRFGLVNGGRMIGVVDRRPQFIPAPIEAPAPEPRPQLSRRALLRLAIKELYAINKERVERRNRPENQDMGLNNLAYINGDGKVIRHWNRPCYALFRSVVPRKAVFICDYASQDRTVASRENCRRNEGFLHYVLNESPFAPVFVTKRAKFVAKYGVIVDPSFDVNYVMSALHTIRTMYEHPDVAPNWTWLTNNGCDPALAIIFGHWGSRGKDYFNISFKTDRAHSWPRLDQLGPMHLWRFMHHNTEKMSKIAMNEQSSYNNLGGVWGKEPVYGPGYSAPAMVYKAFGKCVEEVGQKSAWGDLIRSRIIRIEQLPNLSKELDKYAEAQSNDREREQPVRRAVRQARMGAGINFGPG